MSSNARFVSIAFVLGMSLLPAAQAQTPVPKVPSNLTIRWLNTLSISPTSAAAGSKFTGTVKLARAAVGDMRVDLGLDGAKPVEGAGFVLDGVIVPQSVTVPAGKDQATFTITTSSSVTWIGSKTFTARAYYGSESLSASFTVTRLVTR